MKKRWNGSLWKRAQRYDWKPVHTEFMNYCRSLEVPATPLTDMLNRQQTVASQTVYDALFGQSNDEDLRRKGFMP